MASGSSKSSKSGSVSASRSVAAVTVTDVLARRTQLYFRDADQGLGAIPIVAERMAELLGWTEDDRENSAAAYRAEVARSRLWREPAPTT